METFHEGQKIWVEQADGSQRAGIFVGEAEATSFGGGPGAYASIRIDGRGSADHAPHPPRRQPVETRAPLAGLRAQSACDAEPHAGHDRWVAERDVVRADDEDGRERRLLMPSKRF